MFTLNIATSKNLVAGDPASASFAVLNFTAPGPVGSHLFSVAERSPFDIQAHVVFGPDTLPFSYSNLWDNDTLNMLGHEPVALTSTVFRDPFMRPALLCMAICSGGKSASRCKPCTSGKVCC